MKHRFLVGFTSGFILAYLGGIIIDLSNRGFLAKLVLLLIGAAIIGLLWLVREKPKNEEI